MHRDLFAQARKLATIDRTKPKQANLRRAVSSAYYALFHALVGESCSTIFGTQHAQGAYRRILGRAFTHSIMKNACSSFGGGRLKASVAKGLPLNRKGNFPIPQEIRDIASSFVELQEKRHLADYDLSEQFKRSDILSLIEDAETWLERFLSLRMSDEKKFFLACLWAWRELANR